MYARLMMTAAYDVFGGRTTSSARRERARLIDPIAIAGRYRGSMIGPDERLHEAITLNNEALNEAVRTFGVGRRGAFAASCSSSTARIFATCRSSGQELEILLKRAPFGLALNDYVAGDGSAPFAQACARGLEGIVSKRPSSPYPSGRSSRSLKAKNPESPAVRRKAFEDWGRTLMH